MAVFKTESVTPEYWGIWLRFLRVYPHLDPMATNSESAQAWYHRGQYFAGLGLYDEAITCFDRALEINAEDAYVWRRKGFVLLKTLQYDKAIASYREALVRQQEDAPSWQRIGFALIKQGRFFEAIACCEQSLQINPGYFLAWHCKGWALCELGRYHDAIACYDRILEIDPTRDSARWNKEKIESLLSKREEKVENEPESPVSDDTTIVLIQRTTQ